MLTLDVMLPSLLEIPDPQFPPHDDQLLLMIDNDKYALANVLQYVRENLSRLTEDQVAQFRRHLYHPLLGPVFAAEVHGKDLESAKFLREALQELLDTNNPYARSYAYWGTVWQHYLTKHKEGFKLEEYLPDHKPKVAVQKPRETSLESNKKNAGKRKISAEVKKVLDKAELVADDLEVRLPPEQLPTALYEAVNAVIEDYGGKWNKRRKCHVLKNAEDFKKLQEALKTGVSMNQRTAKQAFYTPAALAQQMIKLANVQPHDRVLEPSAGIGNIAGWMVQLGAEVDCIETDPVAVKHLRELKFNVIYEMDFLKVPPKAKYDKIVMNPPFAKGQDVKHVLHALRFLKPGGRLVSIVSPGLMTSKTKEAVHLQEIVAKYGYPHDVPAGTFKESGANVATILIEIRLPTSTSC